MSADIHTCSYQCDRPACIRAQRDDLAARAEETAAEIVHLRGDLEQARKSCQAMVNQSYKDGFADGIAPAEAKGEAVAWRNPTPYGVGYSFASEDVMRDMVGYVAESFDTPQPACGCGEATCVEPWEPGCGLGTSIEHARVATPQPAGGESSNG